MDLGLSALRVLVIDDSREMCAIIGTVLAGAGVGHLHYAPNGRRALEIIAEFPIDITYVDQEMPEMNGLDFVAAVRAEQSTERYMPIIMLTGHSDLRHINAARDRGVTEFLCKPVTAKAILARLNAVIMEPRPFMNSPTYFGPDRRRVRLDDYKGPLRRAIDATGAAEDSPRAAKG
jgi:two-component system chemotaxis response regulator CheY